MSTPITPQLKEAIRKLVFSTAAQQAKVNKEDIVLEFSGGRTTKLGDLTLLEAQSLHAYLYNIGQEHKRSGNNIKDKQRKAVIAIFRGMGWEVLRKDSNGNPILVADMQRINEWVEINFKNNLNALSSARLSKVIAAAEKAAASHKKSITNAKP